MGPAVDKDRPYTVSSKASDENEKYATKHSLVVSPAEREAFTHGVQGLASPWAVVARLLDDLLYHSKCRLDDCGQRPLSNIDDWMASLLVRGSDCIRTGSSVWLPSRV